jgi:predicted metal-dependent hydrolase
MKKFSQKLPNTVLQGLLRFNQRKFFEAHEDFETAWRQTPGHEREYYRALLQISGGFFRLSQGNAVGAQKFFRLASEWLAQFPPIFRGLDTSAIQANLRIILHDLERERHPSAVMEQHFRPISINPMEENG